MTVAEMIKVQKQRGLTDSQFAESLSIHKVSWYRNKRTGVIGSNVLLRAFEVYPELRGKILFPFANQESIRVENTSHNNPETPPRRFLGDLWARVREWL